VSWTPGTSTDEQTLRGVVRSTDVMGTLSIPGAKPGAASTKTAPTKAAPTKAAPTKTAPKQPAKKRG
jgi:hypothetical protein